MMPRTVNTEAEEPAEETRSLLQTIQEQVVSDVDADTASTGLELKAEHWQQTEAAAAHCYTRCFGTLQDFGVMANTSINQNMSYTRLKEY
jgi:hypothetical protein